MGLQLGQVGIRGKPAVGNQLCRQLAGALFPVIDKVQDGVVLFLFAQRAVGIGEHVGLGIAGQKG